MDNYRVYYDDRSGNKPLYEGFRELRQAYERYMELHKDVGPGKRYRSVWITASMEKVLESYHGQKMARNADGFYTMHEWSNGMEDFENAED